MKGCTPKAATCLLYVLAWVALGGLAIWVCAQSGEVTKTSWWWPVFVYCTKPANQRKDCKMKLPTSQGKATVILLSLSKQYYRMQCLLDGVEGWYTGNVCQERNWEECKQQYCRFCCCLLKIKCREFKKATYILMQNLFMVSKHKGFQIALC